MHCNDTTTLLLWKYARFDQSTYEQTDLGRRHYHNIVVDDKVTFCKISKTFPLIFIMLRIHKQEGKQYKSRWGGSSRLNWIYHIWKPAFIIFVAPALAGCDISVRFSVRQHVRPSIRPSVCSKFTSTLSFKSIQWIISETTAPMVPKFYVWHNQSTGLLDEKIQSRWESKMGFSAKNHKTNEINFNSMAERLRIVVWNFASIISETLEFKNIKIKIICSEIRSQWPFHILCRP